MLEQVNMYWKSRGIWIEEVIFFSLVDVIIKEIRIVKKSGNLIEIKLYAGNKFKCWLHSSCLRSIGQMERFLDGLTDSKEKFTCRNVDGIYDVKFFRLLLLDSKELGV